MIAQANLDVNGRLVRTQVDASTARETIDLLQARLRHRLERSAEHWEAKRGSMPRVGVHEWRHESEPHDRPKYFPRPDSERRIMRHKSYSLPTCTVDEAAFDTIRVACDAEPIGTAERTIDPVGRACGPTRLTP